MIYDKPSISVWFYEDLHFSKTQLVWYAGEDTPNPTRRGVKVSQEVNEYVIFDPSQVYVESLGRVEGVSTVSSIAGWLPPTQ
jgi:hypothetical protein